ncbi:MAG: hypothetical protein II269_02000 [Bacteroidaceae bacterium]|nr:hypothetical protein [Bacteroidaceae bacterium]
MGDIDNIKSYLESDDFKNRLKTFIEKGAYFTKKGNYNTLINFVPGKKKEKVFGFSFPCQHYKWSGQDFNYAIELFISLLQENEKLAGYIKSICDGSIKSYSNGADIFKVIAGKFKIERGTYTNDKGIEQAQSWSQAIGTVLDNDNTLDIPIAGKNFLDYCASYYNSALKVSNNIHISASIDESLKKDTINAFLLNTYVGLCFILNKIEIKDATPKSPASSNSSSNSNTSEGMKGGQENKPETPIEDKQTRKGGNADIPEPNQGEGNQKLNENEKKTEGGITPNPELNTESTPIDPEAKPIDIPEKVADVDEETSREDNAKSPKGERQTGSQTVGANEDGASSPTPISDEDKTGNNDDEDSNLEGQGDGNDGAEDESKNDVPVLSREAILEKLERYEAIYRTFYFDELKSFLTKVDFNDSEDYYGYLQTVLKTDYQIKRKKYERIEARKKELEEKKSREALTEAEQQDLNKCRDKIAPTDYSKKNYGFSCSPYDKNIVIAIEQFFEFLRKEENEELAEIMLNALSWCLSDVNGQSDISYCLKYGETFIERIFAHFGKDIESIKRKLGRSSSDDLFNTNILCFKEIIDNDVKDYANSLHMLRTIRNLDIHHIQNLIGEESWGRTIRLIIHTYIGAFYVANYKTNTFKAPKTLVPDFIFNSDGTLIILKPRKQNPSELEKVGKVTKSTRSNTVELENYQKYSWNWSPGNQEDNANLNSQNPWTLRWNCADIKVILDKNPNPAFHLNTKFAEYLTAYIGEKFNVGVRLDSMEGSIANIARLMNGDETDARSIKSLLLAVLDKVEILGKEKSNVQEHIDEFSEQLKGISQALGEQPEKITEGVISGIKEMDLPAEITKSIMKRIDPKLDRLVETTDNIKEDTATIKEDTTVIKKTAADLKDTTHRIEDSFNEIEDSMVRAAWHTKETSDDVKEVKEKLSEIDKKLNSNPPQQGGANVLKSEGAPEYHIHISGGNIGGISFGGDNTGNKVSGENTENTNSPATPTTTSTGSPEKEPSSLANPHRAEQTKKGDSSNGSSSKWVFLLLVVIIIMGAYFLLGKGSSVEQNVEVVIDKEQVDGPKSEKESGDKSDPINEKEEQEEPGQGPGDKTPPPVQPPTPKPQPKVDANYEAGMAAYNAGEGLEAIKKFKASNSAKANYMIGVIYENGCGNIPANASMAHKYYKIAEEKGNK